MQPVSVFVTSIGAVNGFTDSLDETMGIAERGVV
jgi:hypothetical protein